MKNTNMKKENSKVPLHFLMKGFSHRNITERVIAAAGVYTLDGLYFVKVKHPETNAKFTLGNFPTKRRADNAFKKYNEEGYKKLLLEEGKKYKLIRDKNDYVYVGKERGMFIFRKVSTNGDLSIFKKCCHYKEIIK